MSSSSHPSNPSGMSPSGSPQRPNLFIPFDPESPLFVAKGVLATGTLGAITGASIGVIQSKNPFALSINMTINLSIAGLTFFSIREYLVSPLLLSIDLTPSHTRRYAQLERASLSERQRGKLPSLLEHEDEEAPRSLGQVRMDRVADSALAGALTGGALSAAFRGKATFGRAAFTSSLIGGALQLGVNQLRVIRLKALAKHSPEAVGAIDPDGTTGAAPYLSSSPSGASPSAAVADTPSTSNQIIQSFEEPLRYPPQTSSSSSSSAALTLPERMMNSLSTFLPVRKLTNEEYLATLEKKRADVDKRLMEIDDEEKRMYDWAQAQSGSGAGGR